MEKKNLVMVALCVAIGVMAVAYAAFSTTLNVTGSVSAEGNFAVTFLAATGTECVATTKVGADTPSGTVNSSVNSTTATLSVKLYTPGDLVTCTIPVKNTGTLKARLNGSVAEAVTVTPAPTAPIAVNVTSATAALGAGDSGNVVVTIEYDWDKETQPDTSKLTQTFTINANYTQDIQ